MTGGVPITTVIVPGVVLHTGPPFPAASVSHALNWKVSVSEDVAVFDRLTTPPAPSVNVRWPTGLAVTKVYPFALTGYEPAVAVNVTLPVPPSPMLTVWLFGVGAVSFRLTYAPGWKVGVALTRAVTKPNGSAGWVSFNCGGPGVVALTQPVSRQLFAPTPGPAPNTTGTPGVAIVYELVLMTPMPAV